MEEIEIGDMVSHEKAQYMEVLDIEGDEALCSYWTKTTSNDGRSQETVQREGIFLLRELRIVRKGRL